MCGRFALYSDPEVIRAIFGLAGTPSTPALPTLPPRFNIAPSQRVPVIRERPEGRRLGLLRWGLVPHWARDPAAGPMPINARGESIGTNPAFRQATRTRRCLIPADGFYEWKAVGKRKQPLFIQVDGGEPFAMGGLWERWIGRDPKEPALETFTIVTTEANDAIRPIHDRMPLILDRADIDAWLNPGVTDPLEIRHLIRPLASDRVSWFAVDPLVNKPANDSPACIQPVPEMRESEGPEEPTLWG